MLRDEMKVGSVYKFNSGEERIVYLGEHWSGDGYWHQFSLVEKRGEIWCEFKDNDLKLIIDV